MPLVNFRRLRGMYKKKKREKSLLIQQTIWGVYEYVEHGILFCCVMVVVSKGERDESGPQDGGRETAQRRSRPRAI